MTQNQEDYPDDKVPKSSSGTPNPEQTGNSEKQSHKETSNDNKDCQNMSQSMSRDKPTNWNKVSVIINGILTVLTLAVLIYYICQFVELKKEFKITHRAVLALQAIRFDNWGTVSTGHENVSVWWTVIPMGDQPLHITSMRMKFYPDSSHIHSPISTLENESVKDTVSFYTDRTNPHTDFFWTSYIIKDSTNFLRLGKRDNTIFFEFEYRNLVTDETFKYITVVEIDMRYQNWFYSIVNENLSTKD